MSTLVTTNFSVYWVLNPCTSEFPSEQRLISTVDQRRPPSGSSRRCSTMFDSTNRLAKWMPSYTARQLAMANGHTLNKHLLISPHFTIPLSSKAPIWWVLDHIKHIAFINLLSENLFHIELFMLNFLYWTPYIEFLMLNFSQRTTLNSLYFHIESPTNCLSFISFVYSFPADGDRNSSIESIVLTNSRCYHLYWTSDLSRLEN